MPPCARQTDTQAVCPPLTCSLPEQLNVQTQLLLSTHFLRQWNSSVPKIFKIAIPNLKQGSRFDSQQCQKKKKKILRTTSASQSSWYIQITEYNLTIKTKNTSYNARGWRRPRASNSVTPVMTGMNNELGHKEGSGNIQQV